MVVLVDLDEDPVDPPIRFDPVTTQKRFDTINTDEDDRIYNENVDSALFFHALTCYPIACQIAQSLDLNSLHDLSATCRQAREALVPNRASLIKQTLRCTNDELSIGPRLADRMRESHHAWTRSEGHAWRDGRITSGRVGLCARDMVGECRRCCSVVCRNCTIKPPPPKSLQGRHRRLCRTCNKAPLNRHMSESESFTPSPNTFTSEAFVKGFCTCPDIVYLCLSCGNGIRSSDTTYMRGWTWRTRYSTYLGGLGTGIGEGNEGVECGKGELCLAAREVEKEIDCDSEELENIRRDFERFGGQGRPWDGSGYMAQEIEGIGGVVKKKVKKRIKVGAVVKEYEDEREDGDYLNREQRGLNRSWCFWCLRVLPSIKDKKEPIDELSRALTSESSSSSVNINE